MSYNLGFQKQIDNLEKRKLEISEETSYVNLMVRASDIIKRQQIGVINGYDQEILKIADYRIRLKYNINS